VILDLDDERALDPSACGAKGAWLARGRRLGLPIEPGFVVTADASRGHLARGGAALLSRGSGGARLEMFALPIDAELAAAARTHAADLGSRRVIVRSSSILEGSGAWSGAFTSYPDMEPGSVDVGIRGCWAAVFSVDAIARHEAAGISPGSIPLAVIVQPHVAVDAGGTAWIEGSRALVLGVAGSPAPLVQGWEPGVRASVDAAGRIRGDDARELLGDATLRAVAGLVHAVADATSATTIEWGRRSDGTIVLFQLQRRSVRRPAQRHVPRSLRSPIARQLDQLVRRFPGALGEALILPWAVADPTLVLATQPGTTTRDARTALHEAELLCASLTASAWRLPDDEAPIAAGRALAALRGTRPGRAISQIARLASPDPGSIRAMPALVERVRHGVAEAGIVDGADGAWHVDTVTAASVLEGGTRPQARMRVGFDRWEPFSASVSLAHGRAVQGTSGAPGIGVGRFQPVASASSVGRPRSRAVILGSHPIAMLGPLLWDAAAVVTTGGGPGAHLFEAARALGIPAVCGVNLDEALGGPWQEVGEDWVAVVDGDRGIVTVTPW
jgi:hypothetical protein